MISERQPSCKTTVQNSHVFFTWISACILPLPCHNIKLTVSEWNRNACTWKTRVIWVCLHAHRVTSWGPGLSQIMTFTVLCGRPVCRGWRLFSIFTSFAHVMWICGVELSIFELCWCSNFSDSGAVQILDLGTVDVQLSVFRKLSYRGYVGVLFFFNFTKSPPPSQFSIQ